PVFFQPEHAKKYLKNGVVGCFIFKSDRRFVGAVLVVFVFFWFKIICNLKQKRKRGSVFFCFPQVHVGGGRGGATRPHHTARLHARWRCAYRAYMFGDVI
ncbi:hypothetical protein, partial [Enterobacter intestinihominis]